MVRKGTKTKTPPAITPKETKNAVVEMTNSVPNEYGKQGYSVAEYIKTIIEGARLDWNDYKAKLACLGFIREEMKIKPLEEVKHSGELKINLVNYGSKPDNPS